METYHRPNWKSRFNLADTMAELSRFQTLASQTTIVPAELDRALADTFDCRRRSLPLEVFGVGLRHAAGDKSFQFTVPADVGLSPAQQREFEQLLTDDWELAMLRGAALNTPLPWLDTYAHKTVEQTYQAAEEKLSNYLKAEGGLCMLADCTKQTTSAISRPLALRLPTATSLSQRSNGCTC
jgi:hypothetical protein